ncbi:hypothetical protein [Celerinatantimonas yamalensis]|uniref:Uncharacterized protein n=1 Tax=Celerinatantimonas yamalensis TaxID=559956 RepID=A0ABW9G2V8_9GAMM
MRLTLKVATPSVDVRQSIGIGGVSSLRAAVKNSTGEAFTLSGTGSMALKVSIWQFMPNPLSLASGCNY